MTDLACAIDLLEDRASLYRLLASLYYQPLSEEQIDALPPATSPGWPATANPPSRRPIATCTERCACGTRAPKRS